MSNTLTIALASLGGVVLAGVIAHGAWAARKAGPKRADAVDERSEPREPVMEGVGSPEADLHDAGPTLAALHSPAPERRAGKRIVPRLDALIDSIATLRVDAPIGGAQVLAAGTSGTVPCSAPLEIRDDILLHRLRSFTAVLGGQPEVEIGTRWHRQKGAASPPAVWCCGPSDSNRRRPQARRAHHHPDRLLHRAIGSFGNPSTISPMMLRCT